MVWLKYGIFAVPFLWLNAAFATQALDNASARQIFQKAELAIEKRQYAYSRSLSVKIKGYELYPYLRYLESSKRLSTLSNEQIDNVLTEIDEEPVLRPQFRSRLLKHFSRAGRWRDFVSYYTAEDESQYGCVYLNALLNIGQYEQAMERAEELWMTGSSRPKSCDPVFVKLYDSGRIDREEVWQRIELAFEANNPRLATYLSKMLPARDQADFRVWAKAHSSSEKMAEQLAAKTNLAKRERFAFKHAVQRFARKDAVAARQYWNQHRASYVDDGTTYWDTEKKIGVQAAYQFVFDADEQLAPIPSQWRDTSLEEWQVRTALRHRKWESIQRTIEAFPESLQSEAEWRYWLGRSALELGNHVKAENLLRPLSKRRSYYGFLAADILDLPYHMNHEPIEYTEQGLLATIENSGLRRIRELLAVNKDSWARREWFARADLLSQQEKEAGAIMAKRAGWYDIAIRAANLAGANDDLEIRFPLYYQPAVEKHSFDKTLDTAWILGILRRESAFRSDARSHVGALGLMQVMPRTGKSIARKTKTPLSHTSDLLKPQKNIRIGSAYLSFLLDRFQQNRALATAAYNAGPQAVTRWMPEFEPMAAEIWIETIPYKETRNYTQSVLSYAVVYGWRMNGQSLSLYPDRNQATIPLARRS